MHLLKISRAAFTGIAKQCVVYTARSFSSIHTESSSPLTSCEELHDNLQNPKWYEKLRIIDARYNIDDRDYHAFHMENRISGSKFFSVDDCRNKTSPYPFMLPTSRDFANYMTNLGVSNEHHVIVYDDNEMLGAFVSPRVWWMFRAFGHHKVSLLDGGFGKWCSDGYPTVSGEYTDEENIPKPSQPFMSEKEPKFVVNFDAMKKNVMSPKPALQLVDTRLNDEFSAGHIPGSKMVPYTDYFNADKTMKSKDDLKQLFHKHNVDLDADIIATCEVGVTATLAAHALWYSIGKGVPVYDGSFSEWKERAPELVAKKD